MQLPVLLPTDPKLRMVCEPLTKAELRLNKTQDMIEDLLDFVYGDNNKGPGRDRSHSMTVGLSANQVGINKQISVVDLAVGRKNLSDIHVLINPHIIWQSKSQHTHIEGCVNLPNIWGPVTRSKRIKLTALDRSGNELILTLQGWPAILLQHEVGHLQGQLFIDHLKHPEKAHLVKDADYKVYRKNKATWKKFIDVRSMIPQSKV